MMNEKPLTIEKVCILILIIQILNFIVIYSIEAFSKSDLMSEEYYVDKCMAQALEYDLIKPGFELVAKWDCMLLADKACRINGCS